MSYFGWKGNKWPENVNEGDGFDQGDVVEVDVDRPNKTIINGGLKATGSN